LGLILNQGHNSGGIAVTLIGESNKLRLRHLLERSVQGMPDED
jgi:hypothetical protein